MGDWAITHDWVAYDGVAEPYDRVLGVNGYALLANDLTRLLPLPRGSTVLDVGCGTGAAMASVRDAERHGGICVGLDPSRAMLRRAAAKGLQPLAAGRLPNLPFRSASFDGVVANLVMSHVEVREAAFHDILRVLKPGGSLGVTAWTAMRRDERAVRLRAYTVLREVAASFVRDEALDEAFAIAVPSEGWFADPERLKEAFVSAGLEHVQIYERSHAVSLRTEEYLVMMGAMALGRFMRHELEEEGWCDFAERARAALDARLGGRIEYTASAWVAVGRRPCP